MDRSIAFEREARFYVARMPEGLIVGEPRGGTSGRVQQVAQGVACGAQLRRVQRELAGLLGRFQRLDPLGDVGLHGVKFVGGAGEAAQAR